MKNINRDKPWVPFIWILGIAVILIGTYGWILYCKNNNEFDWRGIHTESVGMLLDIIFLGVIWSIFEYQRNKKSEIRRYLEEIDDFRPWKSEEATYRIVGNIRRLTNLNYNKIDLSYCFLNKAELWNLKISADATGAKFINAKMAGAELCNINLSFAHFEKAHLYDSKLNGSDILFANFKGANIKNVDFRGCINVEKAYFHGALFIWEAIFDDNIDIEQLKLQKENESILGSGEPFFLKIDFVETIFQCSVIEFKMSEYNDKLIVLRFTKEGFQNYKNLINIVGEHKHYYHGHLKLEDLQYAMSMKN
jgi:cbb3-type cytochrome oxidase subunit 3